MSEFAEQLAMKFDALAENQQRIFELGKLSTKLIRFTIYGYYSIDGTVYVAIDGMTFRQLLTSENPYHEYLSTDGTFILWCGERVDADIDDTIVDEGIYDCIRGFYIGNDMYYGVDMNFSDWVASENNTAGFYIDGNRFIRSADGQYVGRIDVYETGLERLLLSTNTIEDEESAYYYLYPNMLYLDGTGVGYGSKLQTSWTWEQLTPWYVDGHELCCVDGYVKGRDLYDETYNWYLILNGSPVLPTDSVVHGGKYTFAETI